VELRVEVRVGVWGFESGFSIFNFWVGVWDLGSGVSGFGFWVLGFGFAFRVLGLGRWGIGLWVWRDSGFGCKVQDSEFRVQGVGFGAWTFRFRVYASVFRVLV
jgi:hypothetical protein